MRRTAHRYMNINRNIKPFDTNMLSSLAISLLKTKVRRCLFFAVAADSMVVVVDAAVDVEAVVADEVFASLVSRWSGCC